MEVVNKQDKNYCNGNYFNIDICLGCLGMYTFKVYYYNDDFQGALELLGEYCKEQGYSGLIDERSYDEILADCNNDEDIFNEQYYSINGGEYYLCISDIHVKYVTEE